MPTAASDKTLRELQRVLTQYNWRVTDEDLSLFSLEDVTEIYQLPEFKQVYANDEFWNLCSYSPEQMATLPFDEIFFRPLEINRILQERVLRLLEEKRGGEWSVPLHELVEIQHPQKRTFEMNLKFIAPIWDSNQEHIVAILTSLTVNHIFSWPDRIF